jgi:hypothetical protein
MSGNLETGVGHMQFEIKKRVTGEVLFTAELDAKLETEHFSVQLGAAVKLALKADADLAASLGSPDGWNAWTYLTKDGEQRIQVGCRDVTLAEGRTYWANKSNRREVLAALDYAEAIARIRGWHSAAVEQAAE